MSHGQTTLDPMVDGSKSTRSKFVALTLVGTAGNGRPTRVNVAAGAMLSDQNHGKSTGMLTLVVKSTRRHVSARACPRTRTITCAHPLSHAITQVSMILHFTRRRLSGVARPAASEPAATSPPWPAPPSPPPPSPLPPLQLPSLPPSLCAAAASLSPSPLPSHLALFGCAGACSSPSRRARAATTCTAALSRHVYSGVRCFV